MQCCDWFPALTGSSMRIETSTTSQNLCNNAYRCWLCRARGYAKRDHGHELNALPLVPLVELVFTRLCSMRDGRHR